MENFNARILVTRRPEDLMRELDNTVSISAVEGFIKSTSAVVMVINGISSGIEKSLCRYPQINSLFGKSSSLLITGCFLDIQQLSGSFPYPAIAKEILNALNSLQPIPNNFRAILRDLGKRTIVMGILNTTPDSFSDGGQHNNLADATKCALRMLEDGADIIDIGGESTRPGAEPVDSNMEIQRVVPVIEAIRQVTDAPISIDTHKSTVAEAAYAAGASMINDISSGMLDSQMAATAARAGCPVVLMHMRGTPLNMQTMIQYSNIMGDIYTFLSDRINHFIEAGCSKHSLIIDPGFGFSKTSEHNLEILRRLAELRSLGCPVLIGTSRKSTIGKILGDLPVDNRLEGTAATVAIAIANGADIVRIHDVKEMVRVVKMTDAIVRDRSED